MCTGAGLAKLGVAAAAVVIDIVEVVTAPAVAVAYTAAMEELQSNTSDLGIVAVVVEAEADKIDAHYSIFDADIEVQRCSPLKLV